MKCLLITPSPPWPLYPVPLCSSHALGLLLLLLLLLLLVLLPMLVLILDKIHDLRVHPGIVRAVATSHHDGVVNGLKIAVHVSPWGILVIIPGKAAGLVFLAVPEGGSSVVSGERDDSDATIIFTITVVVVVVVGLGARASDVVDTEDPTSYCREHVPDPGIKLLVLAVIVPVSGRVCLLRRRHC